MAESQEVVRYEEPQGKPEVATVKNAPPPQVSKTDVQDQITALLPLAGTIELTKEQEDALYAPVDENMVEIRPDGLIYLPWMEYVTRLRKAFGMAWTMIPYGNPKQFGDQIHWAFWLIIKGKPYGFAVGEQQYFENGQMTYASAVEGAKSNALMRLCKGLGISLELWQPEFRRKWMAKNAESFPAVWPDGKPKLDKRSGKQKTEWRRKGTTGNPIIEGETEEPPQQPAHAQHANPNAEAGPVPITEQQKKLIFAKLKEKNIPLDDLEGAFTKKLSDFNKFPDVNNALEWLAKQKARQ